MGEGEHGQRANGKRKANERLVNTEPPSCALQKTPVSASVVDANYYCSEAVPYARLRFTATAF